MKVRTALTSILCLMLGVGAYAGVTVGQMPDRSTAGSSVAHGMSLGWAPDWLARPLSRAIADAYDPRKRSKGTGAPID